MQTQQYNELVPVRVPDVATSGRTRISEDLYERLRNAIIVGELRPNEPLIETTLAERLGVSRTPVRESLQRLSAMGLVVPRRRGWAVREFAAAHVMQAAEVRAALEGYATFLAAQRGSDEELRRIADVHQARLQLDGAAEKQRVDTNREFHDCIIRASGNSSIADSIYGLGQFYFSGTIAQRVTEDELRQGNIEHGEIVDALLARDPLRAEQAMRRHIYRTFEVYKIAMGAGVA